MQNIYVKRALQILESEMTHYGALTVTGPDTVKDYFRLRLMNHEHEQFHVLYLNSKHQFIDCRCMFTGTIDAATIYPREVAKTALELNAAAVVFAHNHPSGNPDESNADVIITKRLTDALELLNIRVLDHIIVAGDKTKSFSEHGLI